MSNAENDALTTGHLGARLRALCNHIDQPCDAVWDLAADHGLLADALQRSGQHGIVHAVDIVPALCERMARRYPDVQVHCADIRALQLPPSVPGALLVLAGLGGDTVADLIEDLVARHPGWPLRFVLCPVRQCFGLRERLAALPLEVERESLVCERGRLYEVMRLRVVARPRKAHRPWPVGEARFAGDGLLSRYLAERVHAHRHNPGIATRYAALQSTRDKEPVQCVG